MASSALPEAPVFRQLTGFDLELALKTGKAVKARVLSPSLGHGRPAGRGAAHLLSPRRVAPAGILTRPEAMAGDRKLVDA